VRLKPPSSMPTFPIMLLSDAEIYSRRQGKMQEQIREPAAKIEI